VESRLSFTSIVEPCEYLPDRLSRLRYDIATTIEPAEYLVRLRAGWRRFGPIVFRPECPSCRMCKSLRIPVDTFRASESQRRAWKKNTSAVSISVGSPSTSPEKLELFHKFHQHGHDTKGWPASSQIDLRLFVHNPFPVEEWSYTIDGRVIGIGYVDAMPEALSAIYFYWDPDERHRSLGTFNILALLESARQRGVPHVYLGYFVAGCRSLEYKARFEPNEVLTDGGAWEPFVR
jgi:arginine-tRNA-protein transferase